jgi:hypothetical protein
MRFKKREFLTLVFLLLLLLAVPMLCSADEGAPLKPTFTHIKDMHKHPWFFEVLASSFVGWLIGQVKGFSSTKDWLAKYWPRTPLLVVFLLDLFVFVAVGAYFGTGIYNPENFLAALGAGLSWPIGLGSLATK